MKELLAIPVIVLHIIIAMLYLLTEYLYVKANKIREERKDKKK